MWQRVWEPLRNESGLNQVQNNRALYSATNVSQTIPLLSNKVGAIFVHMRNIYTLVAKQQHEQHRACLMPRSTSMTSLSESADEREQMRETRSIIAGDFNQLNTSFLEHNHGLVQMVNSATHCDHLIDKIFVSRPDVYSCDVYSSILKTKHRAAFLTCTPTALTPQRSKRKVQLYDMRAPNIDRLRHNLALYPWGNLLHCTDTLRHSMSTL